MRRLRMRLFGSFELGDEAAKVTEMTLHSRRLTQLLAYILINRGELLTQQALTETFWEGRSGNPEGALKNLMCRLRNALKSLGSEEFICTVPGAYRWNPEIEVETDYEKYEGLAQQLRQMTPGTDTEEKKKLCREITEAYGDNVTPRVANDTWILPRVIWYRTIYTEAAKLLCRIYEAERNWDDLERLSEQALTVEILDEELHCYRLKALYGQKKYDLAIQNYENSGKMFYENIGVRYPEKLRTIFGNMMSERQEMETNLTSFMAEIAEQGDRTGAFFCDFQIFRQIYRMEARRIERMGSAEYIMMMTVRRSGKFMRDPLEDQGLTEGMAILEKLIRRQLRSGDVATQYSPTQFIILLPACSYESGVLVAQRICRRFEKKIGQRKLEILFELGEIQPATESGDKADSN